MSAFEEYVLQLLDDRVIVDSSIIDTAKAQVEREGDHDDPEAATLKLIIDQEYTTHEAITKAIAEEFDMEVADLGDVRVDSEVLELIDRKFAADNHVFPLHMDEHRLEIAIRDPLNTDMLDNLAHKTGREVETLLASTEAIERAIKHYYEGATIEGAEDFYKDLESEKTEDELRSELSIEMDTGNVSEEEGPIIKYVQSLIMEAIKKRASDIHMEPLEKRFRVRYRVDGVLLEIENPPKRLQPAIISRLKLMANISIAEKRIPQDGRIQVKTPTKDLDLRVSSLPTAFGESIVMRILDKEGLQLGLPELGFFSDDQTEMERLITMPDGIFLVTGPTGSGKSTTLYSCLNFINHPDRKIITVEDPVEYQMSGINQVQVRREVGMDFAAALRSMLRQAPNIIMIGEIRDRETAEIAINASLTGHMVFSTLHTNDAPSAVSRLVDIGVKPFLVSASLRGALAQRLVRVICKGCRCPDEPGHTEMTAMGITPEMATNAKFMRGAGCDKCNGRGYRGRNGLFELFIINDEVRQMIYEHATLVELRRKAREIGMRTMREDGIRKILAGVTTIEEVLKVTVADRE